MGADPQGVIQSTKPAKPEEYADLKQELESIGYELETVKRYQYRFLETRSKTIREQSERLSRAVFATVMQS